MKNWNVLEDIAGDAMHDLYPEKEIDSNWNQYVPVSIMVDTGDGNYDYTLNSLYPSFYGRRCDEIPEKSSLLWLAKQQGYDASDLKKALYYPKTRAPMVTHYVSFC